MFQVDCSLSECKAKKEASLMEREQVSEPVSAMERERTMRNLVDMQRKVEQRQQRDRERQLLRVRQGVERDTACSWLRNESRIDVTLLACLSGSGAPVNHPEQKGRGRPAWPETHRQDKARYSRSTTGNYILRNCILKKKQKQEISMLSYHHIVYFLGR